MKILKKLPTSILITGASSGLGAALAVHYAGAGVMLFLQGRNAQRLDETARQCRKKGALVQCKALDVTDTTAMEAWVMAADAEVPLELIIANAGISAGTGGDKGESSEQVKKIFATNIDGVLNTIQPIIPAMIARRNGQIAIISSLAGIRALPSSPAYSASKACVRYYGEALRGWVEKFGVKVNVVCPGYITTPMTDVNNFPMPFIMTPQIAAARIANELAQNRARIAFPRRLYWPLWWLSCLSPRITDPLFALLPAKPAAPTLPTL